MENDIFDDLCVICQDKDVNDLRDCKNGIQSLIEYSNLFDLNQLLSHLSRKLQEETTVKVHKKCQKNVGNYIRKRKIDPLFKIDLAPKVAKVTTRRSIDDFNWKSQCLFCGKQCVPDPKHPDRRQIWPVTFLHYKNTILKFCDARQNDEWGEQVRRRVINCCDLVQAEAQYHEDCRKEFTRRTGKPSGKPAGRPINERQNYNFEKLCNWLECESEIYSMAELHNKMIEIAGSEEEAYTRRWLKKMLEKKYSSFIYFAEMHGKTDVVCFRDAAGVLINNKWYESRKNNVQEEAERVVKQAAKIILGQIRTTKYDTDVYPSYDDVSDINLNKSLVPSYLRLFLETIISKELKQVSIGQTIVNAVKPRSSISPIMFGLGIEVDKVFGSRWLLTELNRLGFSISYDEATRYKQSVICNENISDFLKTNLTGSFSQWSADNVDHNVCTIDGKGTLHGMGIVVSTTPGTTVEGLAPIRRQKMQQANEVAASQTISLIPYDSPENTGLSKVKLKPLEQLQLCNVIPQDLVFDHIWHCLSFMGNFRPSWSGYMTDVSKGEYPGKATVSLLPIIDLKPTDMTCIFSTLKFVEQQAKQLNLQTAVITFDQPLWIKAFEIIEAKSLNIVCMLGGFHLLMSFLGSIGAVMKGSGLEEAMEQIYAENSVPHIISGKAVSRALRAHFLVESALVNKLMDTLIDRRGTDEEDEELTCENEQYEEYIVEESDQYGTVHITELKVELESFAEGLNEEQNVFDIEQYPTIAKLQDILDNYKDVLRELSRTAKLWLQYLYYIDVVKIFIRAERTGNFNLYLMALGRTINLFAATAHINYAKCASLHLQQMVNLHNSQPWVYTQFTEGRLHTIRRSDRYWAGLWGDLIIEQVMMRSLKSNGGLTRGRGVSESTRQLWLGSMHRCADIHNAMSELTGAYRKTSEQHVDMAKSRIKRDNNDLATVQNWFDLHEPFDESESCLKSLSSGLIGDELNCDDAEMIGLAIQRSLDEMCMEDVTIKRNSKVKTFQDLLPSTKIGEKKVFISPTILFSRLTALTNFCDDKEENFSFELTPEPTALFKQGMMRKPTKANLRNHLIESENPIALGVRDVCIVDGGMLLHKVYWPKSTFSEVLDQYVSYLKRRCATYKTVSCVFDGYSNESTKSQEHQRRTEKTSATIAVKESTRVTSRREVFLSNPSNKDQLIQLLCKRLENEGYFAVQSCGDADVLIVKQALDYAKFGRDVFVMAEDTDILVLMVSHWREYMGDMVIGIEKKLKKKASKRLSFWRVSTLINKKSINQDTILLAHAWTGCDTTSAIHQKGRYLDGYNNGYNMDDLIEWSSSSA